MCSTTLWTLPIKRAVSPRSVTECTLFDTADDLMLRFRRANGELSKAAWDRSAAFGELFDRWCAKKNLDRARLRFQFDVSLLFFFFLRARIHTRTDWRWLALV